MKKILWSVCGFVLSVFVFHATPVAGQRANRGDGFGELRVTTMGEIEAKHVGPGLHQREQRLRRGTRRADGGDYFVASKILNGQTWLLDKRDATIRRFTFHQPWTKILSIDSRL